MVPERRVDEATTIVERFMIRWRGKPDPRHVKAIDAYWTSAAEHGTNASTFTARVIASTGADVAAALEEAALEESHARRPDRVLGTNVEFWPRSCSTSRKYRHTCSGRCSLPNGRLGGAHTRAETCPPADQAKCEV